MIIDHLELTINGLKDIEEALAAHARYYACRQLLYQLLIRNDVSMPDFLKGQIREIMELRSHDEGPIQRKLHYWIQCSESYRVASLALKSELDEAKKRIAELEKKNG